LIVIKLYYLQIYKELFIKNKSLLFLINRASNRIPEAKNHIRHCKFLLTKLIMKNFDSLIIKYFILKVHHSILDFCCFC